MNDDMLLYAYDDNNKVAYTIVRQSATNVLEA